MDMSYLVGIKFCGACHAGYERKGLLDEIRRKYTQNRYVYAEDGGRYDYVLVLCCCANKCADCRAYHATKGFIEIDHWLTQGEMEKLWD